MREVLKYAAILILASVILFLGKVKEEMFFTRSEEFALFRSYLQRASDPHEKQLRLAESSKAAVKGTRAHQTLTTMKFVDEKSYLDVIKKTYKLVLTRTASTDGADDDWIDAGLYVTIDYGVMDDNDVIFSLSRVTRRDSYWTVLYSLFDNPVHSIRRKITQPQAH